MATAATVVQRVRGYLNLADMSVVGLQVVLILLATYCREQPTQCTRERHILDVLLQKLLWESQGARRETILHVVQLFELAAPNGLLTKNVFYVMYHVQHHLSGPLDDSTLVALYCYWSALFRRHPPLFKPLGANESFWSPNNVPGFLQNFKKQATMERYKLSTVSHQVAFNRLFTLSGELNMFVERWLQDRWAGWTRSFDPQRDYIDPHIVELGPEPIPLRDIESLLVAYTDWIHHVVL